MSAAARQLLALANKSSATAAALMTSAAAPIQTLASESRGMTNTEETA